MLTQFALTEDPLNSALQWFLQKLTDAEAAIIAGADKNQHDSERKRYFSGTRIRTLQTRAGKIKLVIPKFRNGGFVPSFIGFKKRSETALYALVAEAYVNGVSTRKMTRLFESIGLDGISASQVSNITSELDEFVKEFQNRELEDTYPVVYLDAHYEDVRMEDQKVRSLAILTAYAVDNEGKKQILGLDFAYDETEDAYKNFITSLKQRGLRKVGIFVSDAHRGLVNAIKTSFIGVSWQRCKVHFMRNITAHIPRKDKLEWMAKLGPIWTQRNKTDARSYANHIISEWSKKYPRAIETLENGLEDSLTMYDFPEIDSRRISSTNLLDRLHKEIRRRSRVVGVFPSPGSFLRLVGTYLMEYTEDWRTDKAYIKREKLETINEIA